MRVNLFIVNRLGLVHRDGQGCHAVRLAPVRKVVTALQALVFKLPRCEECWPVITDYERHIRGVS